MPQMAPIKWLLLFFIFSASFMLFSMMTFYSYSPNMKSSNYLNKNINSMNWKW